MSTEKLVENDRRDDNVQDRFKHIAINLCIIQKLVNLTISDVDTALKQITGITNRDENDE